MQYSIEQIVGDSGKNYGVGVILDSTLLDGLTDSERIEMVKLYIQSVEGQSFIAYDSSNNPVDVKVEESRKYFENSNGKRVSVNKDLSTKYRQDKTKQESIVLIDELISSAQKRAETASKHSHDWLDDNGKNNWEEWNVIVQDKQRAVWNATLQIATTASGEKVLYDIFPIKKVEQPGNSGTISTTSSKAQTGTNVKSKNTTGQSSENGGVTDRELLREAAGREGASARHEEARLLMEHAQELQTRWDKAVATATQKLQETRQSKETSREGNENAAEEIGGEGVQYSMEQIVGDSGKNYGVGVVLDSTLLDGLTDSERIEMVKLYIQSIGGQSFIAYDSNNNPIDVKVEESRKKIKNSRGKRVSVNHDLISKYNKNTAKQESIILIDELISSAQKSAETAAKHSHDWLDDNGKNNWEEWDVIVQDKQMAIWKATLQIATTASGEKVLYDIFPIKKVERPGKSGTISTTSSKAQTGTNVKSKNAQDQSSEDGGVTDRELLREAAEREGASARHEETRLLMEHAQELQTRWDKVVATATQKLQETRQSKETSREGSENAAEEIGGEGVQYSMDGKNEYGEEVYKTSESLKGLS